jgi:hypothetical protein
LVTVANAEEEDGDGSSLTTEYIVAFIAGMLLVVVVVS